ncbi:hypothetical protein [Burkholderia stabilis]|uniref:hypothetical protein n=1 Tax=Burkholderia stabilis TaxID=95485 RepID=UPI001F0CDB23|nr:hypothetical protein [Burkholderia stabilis]
MKRLTAINVLSPSPATFNPLQGQLVLLGVIAAVESYFRALFRRLIEIDPQSQESVHLREVSYGAALHLPKAMLPEAMLERISFTSKKSIVDGMKELIGVKGEISASLDAAIVDYVRVCHLRHCAVHRFGKLGTSNAIALGLATHKELLEKPLSLTYPALQSAIAISTGLVRNVNNFLFNAVLSRVEVSQWTGRFRNDRKLFSKYYALFSDTVSSYGATPALRATYDEFMRQRAAHAAGQPF